ncbi:phosphoheptose isomerase [Pandoraea cepalis]|uniref:Ubiquinone biosynthesis accessory factor UbiK n=2 Tax=Pandoraea cepalis TaxID=2508294 RepID=A0AAW7MTM7_9BURK|nr:phosphoheptose isomerase [Pandoraea cepalis]MDN4580918.1 phosphoheptose isomerase [Pandoraea cepalis]
MRHHAPVRPARRSTLTVQAPRWCEESKRGRLMKPNEILQDMQAKVSELLKQSPAKDIERNVKSLLNQGFNRLDLVTREEFDVQAQVLARTREKLEALEKRVAELEGLRNEAQD